MRRRQFIAFLGEAGPRWRLAAQAQAALGTLALSSRPRAQPTRMPVIGFISSQTAASDQRPMQFIRQGLEELGFVEGKNVAMEQRYAEGRFERLPVLARELAALRVDIIATRANGQAALAAKEATSAIPIIFNVGVDPVEFGLVAAYNRPGGNITGVTTTTVSLDEKRLEILLELVPAGAPIAMLYNPTNTGSLMHARNAQKAMHSRGKDLAIVGASTAQEIDAAFDELTRRQIIGVIVHFEAFLLTRPQQLVSLAHRHRIWAVYPLRFLADQGGLVSYGPKLADFQDLDRMVGNYIARVLKGDRPADLPIRSPARYELVINQKSANDIGFKIPPSLLQRADEVIE
jgi:putative ABC transport system substrate-binding protein